MNGEAFMIRTGRWVTLVAGSVFWCVMPAIGAPDDGAVDGMLPAKLSADQPVDVDTSGLTAFTFDTLQPRFDRFSWETFVALNWPHGPKGPSADKKIGDVGDNLTAWELWKE